MKSFNKILSVLVIALMLFFTQSITAQQKGNHGKRPSSEQVLTKMTKDLDLTNQQQNQIAEIMKEGEKNRKTIMQGNGEREDKRAAMHKVKKQQQLAIGNVLTDQQKSKAKALRQAQKAQMKEKREARKAANKELKVAVKTYRTENVLPVMKVQRTKLDKKMSRADRKELAKIRKSLADNRAAMKAKKEAFKSEGKKREDITEADRAAFSKLKEERKTEIEKVKVIATKYDSEIKALFEEVKPKSEKWKTDLKAIRDEYQPNEGEPLDRMRKGHKRMPHDKGRKLDRKNGEKMDKSQRMEKAKKMKVVKFLLLDPNADIESVNEVKNSRASSNLKVFPNPSQTFNNVEFRLTEGGEVSLELHDQAGNLIRTIVNEYREAGSYKERVNLGDLTGFVYVYVLKTASGEVLSEKFVIRK